MWLGSGGRLDGGIRDKVNMRLRYRFFHVTLVLPDTTPSITGPLLCDLVMVGYGLFQLEVGGQSQLARARVIAPSSTSIPSTPGPAGPTVVDRSRLRLYDISVISENLLEHRHFILSVCCIFAREKEGDAAGKVVH